TLAVCWPWTILGSKAEIALEAEHADRLRYACLADEGAGRERGERSGEFELGRRLPGQRRLRLLADKASSCRTRCADQVTGHIVDTIAQRVAPIGHAGEARRNATAQSHRHAGIGADDIGRADR